MRARIIIIVMVAACGRIDFAECDRCAAAGSLRCVDGVEQQCHDNGEGCVGWDLDVPCSSGACADDGINACAITPCAEEPVAVTPVFMGPEASSCTQMPLDGNFDYQLTQHADAAGTMIAGRAVSGCWLADFGASCTPDRISVNGMLVESACTDDCGGGTCQQCGESGDAEALVFVSPTLELERFRLRLSLALTFGMTTGGSSSGTPRPEARYVLVCRPACGMSGWNLAVGGFDLQ